MYKILHTYIIFEKKPIDFQVVAVSQEIMCEREGHLPAQKPCTQMGG
jgi:hypothetical protein